MEWTTLALASLWVLWGVVIVQVALTLALARLVGQLMNRRFPAMGARVIDPGPELGAIVDGWEGTAITGKAVQFAFPRQRALFVFYVSPFCKVCARLLPSVRQFLSEIATEADAVWVLVLGTPRAKLNYVQQHGLHAETVLDEEALPSAWRLGGAPFGVWISPKGEVLAKGMTNNREHLESLRNAARTGHPSFQSYLAEKTRNDAVVPRELSTEV
jgi:methylamine dehydrogenase accessory protein MauD